jgi:predicted butyrate kinase (DUF1464 family)
MSLSIGVDYGFASWKLCLLEHGQAPAYQRFSSAEELLAFITHTCALFPEPFIALAAGHGLPLRRLVNLDRRGLEALLVPFRQEQARDSLSAFITSLRSINLNSYILPGIRHLPGLPAYRRLLGRLPLEAALLCRVIVLLLRLRERDAGWHEMRFLYLEAQPTGWAIVVIEDGRITNGVHGRLSGQIRPSSAGAESGQAIVGREIYERAYWEGLQQDLAGLLATHHLEDVVIWGRRRAELPAQLSDLYQFYEFPQHQGEPAGFEAALGAALVALGLQEPGAAAEVVQHLQLGRSIPSF